VPEFFLQRFAADGEVEVLDRETLRRFKTGVDNALVQKWFYNVVVPSGDRAGVESMLGTLVEGPGARAIGRVVDDRKPLTAPGLRAPIARLLAWV
jgi:hypothetical protein